MKQEDLLQTQLQISDSKGREEIDGLQVDFSVCPMKDT